MEALRDGWLCETTHLVMHDPVQSWKNISPEDLEARFARIREISSGAVWAAVPEDVVDYTLMRRTTEIRRLGDGCFEVISTPPVGVRKRTLTFRVEGEGRGVAVNDREIHVTPRSPNGCLFSFDNVASGGRSARAAVRVLG